jgi:hypothetical protein
MPESRMPEDLMRYDLLAQNALKGVVREALRVAENSGLPGEHHFYVAFLTRHPGVQISQKLAERYPREMTIVLQHQFWNLRVLEDRFEVELSFDNVPEHLVVPFDAVKGFMDPAVQFGLQFEVQSPIRPREVDTAVVTPATSEAKPADIPAAGEAPKVVSLDQFRKK